MKVLESIVFISYTKHMKKNILIVLADQWRYQACGFNGNSQVKTPHLDAFAKKSVHFEHAVSGCPVCSPFRASLMTGKYPLTHGVFLNDAPLSPETAGLGDIFKQHGYHTGYIGKWHMDGHGRTAYIPKERRHGFDYWRVLECTHNYFNSQYYQDDDSVPQFWQGYDAFSQTREACEFIKKHANQQKNQNIQQNQVKACLQHDHTSETEDSNSAETPFFLMLSWGPPHDPYKEAPNEFLDMYKQEAIELRPNVPKSMSAKAEEMLSGYYAHCSALDSCFGRLMKTLHENTLDQNTMVLFLSDHGDMLCSQGNYLKQQPWDESIRIPFLIHIPGVSAKSVSGACIDAPDIMPTLLGLNGFSIPESVEGRDFSARILGTPESRSCGAPQDLPENGELESDLGFGFIASYHPFGNWSLSKGGREYRGLRTQRYTYARSLQGPWLLYDNVKDPYQLVNLIQEPAYTAVLEYLDLQLENILEKRNDSFLNGWTYVEKWAYTVDAEGNIPV